MHWVSKMGKINELTTAKINSLIKRYYQLS